MPIWSFRHVWHLHYSPLILGDNLLHMFHHFHYTVLHSQIIYIYYAILTGGIEDAVRRYLLTTHNATADWRLRKHGWSCGCNVGGGTEALWEWSMKWRVNILLSTNDLKHYLTEVRLLKTINEAPKTSLDKWPEILPNRSPYSWNDQRSPKKRNNCYSEKQFELVTANIIASDREYYCILWMKLRFIHHSFIHSFIMHSVKPYKVTQLIGYRVLS